MSSPGILRAIGATPKPSQRMPAVGDRLEVHLDTGSCPAKTSSPRSHTVPTSPASATVSAWPDGRRLRRRQPRHLDPPDSHRRHDASPRGHHPRRTPTQTRHPIDPTGSWGFATRSGQSQRLEHPLEARENVRFREIQSPTYPYTRRGEWRPQLSRDEPSAERSVSCGRWWPR